jgi:hypothetical protein
MCRFGLERAQRRDLGRAEDLAACTVRSTIAFSSAPGKSSAKKRMISKARRG